MPVRSAKPVRSGPEAHKRARRIFARLIGGQSILAIAAAESLSVRRVQQIVRQQLERRDANPADDYALLQIARLERALDLIGGQPAPASMSPSRWRARLPRSSSPMPRPPAGARR
jgi:hypothetical protein